MLKLTAWLAITLIFCSAALSQEPSRYDGPIIDMHMHAFSLWRGPDGEPPPAACYGDPCNPIRTMAKTDDDLLRLSVIQMQQNRIVLGYLSGYYDILEKWMDAEPDLFIASARVPRPDDPSITYLREKYAEGKLAGMGEIGTQYNGYLPGDPALTPYFSLAEELDIPVLIHTLGNGAFTPGFRVAAGNPTLLEEVLVRHPNLRLYVENCGFPYSSEMIAMMYQYPKLYCDVSTITWMFKREAFLDHFERLIRAGLHKRIMFGSDQVIWPEGISIAVETVQSVEFLTAQQRADIFYGNAARFLRLSDEQIAQHHSK